MSTGVPRPPDRGPKLVSTLVPEVHHDARTLAETVSHALRHPHAVPVHRHQQRAAGTPGDRPGHPARRAADPGLRRPAIPCRPHQGLLPSVGRGLPAERRHPGRRALGRPAHHPRRGARSRTDPRHARGAQRLRRPAGPVGRGGASAVRRKPPGLLHVPEARPERGGAGGRGSVSGARGNIGAGARPLRRRQHPDRRRGHLRLGRPGQRLQRGQTDLRPRRQDLHVDRHAAARPGARWQQSHRHGGAVPGTRQSRRQDPAPQ